MLAFFYIISPKFIFKLLISESQLTANVKNSEEIDNGCILKHYNLEIAFNDFHLDYVKKIESQIIFPPSKTRDVKGTSYAEYKDGKLLTFELEEQITNYEINKNEIKNVDFTSIRSEFYKKTLVHGLEKKRKMIETITQNAIPIPTNKDDDLLTKYFQLLHAAKKIGPHACIMSHPNVYNLVMKELQKPENQQRIKEEMEKINSEQ